MDDQPTPPTDTAADTANDPTTNRAPNPLRRSRTSSAWLAVLVLAVLLIFLIVFIAQNTQNVEVSFFGWNGRAPLAVCLLIAAVAGMVTVGTAASLRLLQVRRRVARDR